MTDDISDPARRAVIVGAGAAATAGLATGAAAQDAGEEARKEIATSYLKSLDAGGVSPTTGLGLFEHFTDDAEVYFPKWGVARGNGRSPATLRRRRRDAAVDQAQLRRLHLVHDRDRKFAVEGTSEGEHRDGAWVAGEPDWGAGRFCDTFEVRDGKIARLFIYLDPDYAGQDTERYDWIQRA